MLDAEDRRGLTNVHLTTTFKGVAVPTSVGVLGALVFLITAGSLLLLVLVGGAKAEEFRKELERSNREVRILQLHMQDVENVLIRTKQAERSDFAPWQAQAREGEPDGR